MSGLLDFLGGLSNSLADALPNSIFANIRNSQQMRRGMMDAQNSFFGKPADSVQVTPQVGTLPGEQTPPIMDMGGRGSPPQLNMAQRAPMYQQSSPTPGLLDQLPQAQQPFIRALALGAGIPDATKQAMDYNIPKPMTAYQQSEADKPIFAPPDQTGYQRNPAGGFTPVIQGQPKPPPTRTIQRGVDTVTQEFDPASGQYKDVSTAPRQLPPQPQPAVTPERFQQEQQLRADPAETGWQFLNDPQNNNMPYRANARTGQILDLAGKPYTPTGMGRLPSGNSAQLFTPEQAKLFAQQALAGDKSVFATVGRNSAARTQIAQAMADMAKEQGLSGVDIATINAAFLGDQQAQRTIGTRTGAISVSGQEAKGVANLVNDAYAKLPRGDFRPFNQLRSLYETQTSSPEQAAAYLADFSLQTAYARALNPQGVPRESDIAQAAKLLNGAQSPEAHKAVVDQILKEVGVIQDSTGAARAQAINRIRSERGFGAVPAAAPAPTAPTAPPKIGGVIRYDAQGRRIK